MFAFCLSLKGISNAQRMAQRIMLSLVAPMMSFRYTLFVMIMLFFFQNSEVSNNTFLTLTLNRVIVVLTEIQQWCWLVFTGTYIGLLDHSNVTALTTVGRATLICPWYDMTLTLIAICNTFALCVLSKWNKGYSVDVLLKARIR